ncbi:conserved hypothetical protein [Gammaproteobacteria bacterium]
MRPGLMIFLGLCVLSASVYPFSFSDDEERDAAKAEAKARRLDRLESVPCASSLKNKKVAVMIGERHQDGRLSSKQSNYGIMFQEINGRLRNLGLQTYSQEQITAQIASAELAACLNNNPDAAIAASRRLSASFLIKGMIRSRSHVNPILGINEVFVNLNLSLVDGKGRILSDVALKGDSYAGSDTLSAALTVVQEQADMAVARLYHDYCTQAR